MDVVFCEGCDNDLPLGMGVEDEEEVTGGEDVDELAGLEGALVVLGGLGDGDDGDGDVVTVGDVFCVGGGEVAWVVWVV